MQIQYAIPLIINGSHQLILLTYSTVSRQHILKEM